MRAKSWVLLVIALGCGLVASVGISQVVMENRGQGQAKSTVEILVAVKEMSQASKITAEHIKLEQWPADRVPEGAITDIASIEGKFTQQRFYVGEPILEKKISEKRGGLAEDVPEGYRVFDLRATNAGDGYILPGDHVDVYGFFEKSKGAPATKTQKVIEDVEVLAVDGNAVRDTEDEGGNRSGTTFQLLIKKGQFEALNTANYIGKLSVSLRNLGDPKTLNNDGQEFVDWLAGDERSTEQSIEPKKELAPLPPEAFGLAKRAKSEGEKKHMVVFTPNGLSKYEWSDDSEIPQLVEDKLEETQSESQPDYATYGSGNYVWDSESGQWKQGGLEPQYPSEDSSESSSEGSSTRSGE